MGGNTSKKPFTEWDLIEYSNMTGVPLTTVQKIYQDFQSVTGNNNRMDKKEFRRLYKEMYLSSQTGSNVAPFLTDQDLEKMSDHVFETYDIDGSGKLAFEEFAEIYLMLSHYTGTTSNPNTRKDRFNYILDQYGTTQNVVTRERGEQIFNRLNKYNNLPNLTPTGSTGITQTNVNNNWEEHWKQLDDGTGHVSKEKFLDYVTNSNDYKRHFDPAKI